MSRRVVTSTRSGCTDRGRLSYAGASIAILAPEGDSMSTQSPASGLPPQVVLYQLAAGHYLSHALNLAAKLGIADLLADGPREAQQLADATDTHAPSLRRVLRLLGSARAMVMLFGGDRSRTPGEISNTACGPATRCFASAASRIRSRTPNGAAR